MSFITTGLRELTLKVRRQRTRLALRHEKRVLQKAEITLGREGTSEAANFPEVRAEIVALRKFEQEQKEFALRIAKIEEALKLIDAQRQENSREQNAMLAKLEEEKRPLVARRNEAKLLADNCGKELATVDERLAKHDAADQDLLNKMTALQTTEPPPDDLQTQMERIGAARAGLPNEKEMMLQARAGSADACRSAHDRLAAAEALVAQADKHMAKVRGEFEARDRALNESSRAQQEEVRQAKQQHQTVEEKKNPAYLNIGRHLANAGIAPPNAPHLLTEVQRHRAAVDHHAEHKRELAEVSGRIDKQELRKFYFAVFSILILLGIIVPLALQSPAKRDWLPQDTALIFSVTPDELTKSPLVQRWQKEAPGVWPRVFAGLLGPATRTPALDLAHDASRVTRALVFDAGQLRDYALVETSGDIALVLRGISQDKTFAKNTVSGLVIFQRPNATVARVGPRTLAVGSLGEVDELVQVRLGTDPDLKVDDPLSKEFTGLESESTLRFATRTPTELPRFFGSVFPPELLAGAQLLGFAVVVDYPSSKAHLFVRAADDAAAKSLAAGFKNELGRWLTLPGSDFILAAQEPKIDRTGTDLDLHFDVSEGATRLLLQRLARVEPTPAPSPNE